MHARDSSWTFEGGGHMRGHKPQTNQRLKPQGVTFSSEMCFSVSLEFFQETGRECERMLEDRGFQESRERCLIRSLLVGTTFTLSLLTCADLYANSQTWCD